MVSMVKQQAKKVTDCHIFDYFQDMKSKIGTGTKSEVPDLNILLLITNKSI